jgi:hypothetical protein
MLAHINSQLSQFKRDQIRPAIKSKYAAICSTEVQEDSQYLFGDDLAKQLRDAKEASKISHSVTHTSTRNSYKGNDSSPGKNTQYHRGGKKDFFVERPLQILQEENFSGERSTEYLLHIYIIHTKHLRLERWQTIIQLGLS